MIRSRMPRSTAVDARRSPGPATGGVLRRLRGQDDAGMAMVLVVGSMLVLAMLAMTALAFTIQSQKFARYTQDYGSAMAAAQAGIEDYLSRLNRNDGYADTIDCANTALQRPMTGSNGCGWTTATPYGWLPVQDGETNADAAWFRYSVDNTKAMSEGTVVITSTGRVNGEYRTIEATLGKGGSTDYVYYTDYESADPKNVQAYKPSSSNPEGGATKIECGRQGYTYAKYFYAGRNGEGCVEIQFAPDDRLDGAVYSNDSIWTLGATFEEGFTSLNPGCTTVTASQSTWRNCLRQGPNQNASGSPNHNSHADFNGNRPKAPDEKLDLEDTSAAFAAFPGCHYYGSTRIVFSSNGTMRVWNKTATNGGVAPTSIALPGQLAPSCGSLSDLNSSAGALVNVPTGMVIYTAPAPASVVREQCDSGQLGGPSGRRLPLGDYQDSSIPDSPGHSSTRYDYDTNMAEETRFCAEGNLYVEGIVKGRVTLAAAQSVIVTGDLVLAGGRNGSDILGLVATNSVEVMNPRIAEYRPIQRGASCAQNGYTYRYCPGTTDEDSNWPTRYADPDTGARNPSTGLQIAGSIQTLQHSFYVQKYDEGDYMGTLNVYGSIAQRWRGIVAQLTTHYGGGTSQSGYDKLYEYDRRLALAPPPFFPRWVNSQWSLRYSGEINTDPLLKS